MIIHASLSQHFTVVQSGNMPKEHISVQQKDAKEFQKHKNPTH